MMESALGSSTGETRAAASSASAASGSLLAAHPVAAYVRGVMEGTIPAGRLIRLSVERQARDLQEGPGRGLRFDRQAAEHVLTFFNFLKHSKGEWAGQAFVLEGWQQFILWALFGWKRADGLRRFRAGYIEIPRKNGKSTLVAGVGLYMLTADGEPGAEVYSAATKRDQAKLCWEEAARMAQQAPSLRRMIRHWRASDTLTVEETGSRFMPLGADRDSAEGLNVHCGLIDELHAHRTPGMVEVLETATGARRQPLIVEITTAGYDRTSICWEHHEYSRQVLEGTVVDDTWFSFIAAAEEGEDWTDPLVWARANPNLGVSVKRDDLERKAIKAQHIPIQQNAFKRMHLDMWTQQSDRWIEMPLWDANARPEAVGLEDLAGEICYGGLDLSSVQDISAWVLVFPVEESDEEVDILARFWCPGARLTDDGNRYAAQYQAWARAGWLTATPGDAIDYQAIKRQVLEDAQRFRLVDLNVDRLFQGYQLSMELADEGIRVFGMGQGFLSMAVPMREFERRMLDRALHHGNNPVLRFMADSVVVAQDAAGNLKPDKANSQARIDGVVALVMALDRAMRREQPKRSVYEDRGIESA
jgi:phage terminase large subunit-like protein